MNRSVIEIISTYYHYVFQRSVGFAIVGSLLISYMLLYTMHR
jgi:hypothetical protein